MTEYGYADISLTDFGSYKKLNIEFNIHKDEEGSPFSQQVFPDFSESIDTSKIEIYDELTNFIPLIKIDNVYDFNLGNIAPYTQECNTNVFASDIVSPLNSKNALTLYFYKPYIVISRDQLQHLNEACQAILLIERKVARFNVEFTLMDKNNRFDLEDEEE